MEVYQIFGVVAVILVGIGVGCMIDKVTGEIRLIRKALYEIAEMIERDGWGHK